MDVFCVCLLMLHALRLKHSSCLSLVWGFSAPTLFGICLLHRQALLCPSAHLTEFTMANIGFGKATSNIMGTSRLSRYDKRKPDEMRNEHSIRSVLATLSVTSHLPANIEANAGVKQFIIIVWSGHKKQVLPHLIARDPPDLTQSCSPPTGDTLFQQRPQWIIPPPLLPNPLVLP